MQDESRRLYDLGFSLIWLHPKSKRPTETNWTKGPRKPWAELKAAYRPGFNLGVRLGGTSKLTDGSFLAAIDCDVKSTEEKHLREMERRLDDIIQETGAVVLSGRGNGSRHVYVRTGDAAKPRRLAQSPDKVKVLMPSVKPTKKEMELLTDGEIQAGIRLRAAWEISLMGEGQQVVLPPSIHPDTGGLYAWEVAFTGVESLPVFKDSGGTKKGANDGEWIQDFKVVPVLDLELYGVSKRIIGLIESGEGCEDRSAGLFSACIELLRVGLSRDEILTILTDPATYLGQAAYEHAKTKSRKRAAQWVEKYTMRKAARETVAAEQFRDVAIVDTILGEGEARAQAEEIGHGEDVERDWREDIERVTGSDEARPKSTLNNIELILVNAIAPDVFRLDEFTGSIVYGVSPPWGDAKKGDEIKDIDLVNVTFWFTQNWRFEPAEKKVMQAISQIASHNKFHSVRDYLGALPEWDGVSRADTWLKDYMGAEAMEPYLSQVSRKVLVAMVSRVMNPGTKFDQILILEGPQGVGKSTALRILAEPWFSDAHLNIGDKDALLAMRSIWLMEMGELSSMRKADVDALKEFITRQVDRVRVPYGRLSENFPRQCIFIGTTNSDEYLKDITGNRRFWPVKVGQCDFEGLKRARSQLFAEALFLYGLDEPLYLDDRTALTQSIAEQSERTESDMWVEVFQDFMKAEKAKPEKDRFDFTKFRMSELFSGFGPFAEYKPGMSEQKRVANIMRQCGFTKKKQSSEIFWTDRTPK